MMSCCRVGVCLCGNFGWEIGQSLILSSCVLGMILFPSWKGWQEREKTGSESERARERSQRVCVSTKTYSENRLCSSEIHFSGMYNTFVYFIYYWASIHIQGFLRVLSSCPLAFFRVDTIIISSVVFAPFYFFDIFSCAIRTFSRGLWSYYCSGEVCTIYGPATVPPKIIPHDGWGDAFVVRHK